MRVAFVVALLSAVVGVSCAASLYIDRFDAAIELLPSGRLDVVETLTVVFLSSQHGIYRDIPVAGRIPGGAKRTIDLHLERITLDGATVPYTTGRSGDNLSIRIGDPNRTVTGTHTYVIAYTVDRALLFQSDYLRIYWNATGNDWQVPISAASATITLPSTVPADRVGAIAYVGYYGTTNRADMQTDSQGRWVVHTGRLNPGEGVSVDLSIPRDVLPIQPPTAWQLFVWFAKANWFILLPVLTLAAILLLWFKLGRDPRKGIVAPAFEAPRGVGPGEAGVLIDDRVDLRDISAMVIGLAVKGYLTIREEQPSDPSLADRVKAWTGRPPSDYTFVRAADEGHPSRGDRELSVAEKKLLDAIFPTAETKETPLSSLENAFYKYLPEIKLRLYDELIQKGYYPNNPERTRRSYTSAGVLVVFGGVALGVTYASLYLGAAVAACGLIILAFAPFMPRKTQKGVGVLVELLGLSDYIQRAEVDRLEFHDAPEKSPEVFEKLLPYAVALNLTSVWTKQFEGLLKEPPNWYAGASTFNAQLFGFSMARLSLGMQRTFVSAPRTAPSGRSAWGGGGGGFGGGFSGGGFGGGGGGGW
jgi:uncharacterized membrane protein YgcG